jgi:hypothetical protein
MTTQDINSEVAIEIYNTVQGAVMSAQQRLTEVNEWTGEVDGTLTSDFMTAYEKYYSTTLVSYLRVVTKRVVDEILIQRKVKS